MGFKNKSKRAGSLASLISQAIVPFGLLGLQQTYRRHKRGGKRTRKNRTTGRRHH